MNALESILGREEISEFFSQRPIKHGLSAKAYTSEDFFNLEQDRVFADNWTFIGYAHELAKPGDAAPTVAAGLPVLMVKGADSRIRVFHNVCRHRGLKLVDQPCRFKTTIVCPYHAWTYGLDGRLIRSPHFGGYQQHLPEHFDPGQYGLVEIRSKVWHDWIFVNPGGDAPEFDDYVAPLLEFTGGHDLDRIRPMFKMDSGEFRSNWKFICENFVEPYHVPVAHPVTAGGQPLSDHYLVGNGRVVGCAVDVSGHRKASKQGEASKVCLDMSAKYLVLFPNFLFFTYDAEITQINVMLNTPLAPDRTHQRRVVYRVEGQEPSESDIERWRRLTLEVIAEDRALVERMQEGRRSPVTAGGGVLSPVWEESEHCFQRLIMEAANR